MSSFDLEPQKHGNPGFQVGLVGGLTMIFVSIAVFFMNGADVNGDGLVWFIQVAVYFFLARTAANRQVDRQSRSYEPTRGVQGAAVGAPLVASIMMWIFVILRGIVRDAIGITITIEPVSFCGQIILDVVIAIGIGWFTGRSIVKQIDSNSENSSSF